MIVGLGVDVVNVQRFATTIERTPGVVNKTLTIPESSLSNERMAARFAAKEALAKAIGPHRFSWHDVEIVNDEFNAPYFQFNETAQQVLDELKVSKVHLSLTHDGDVAAAFVIAEA